MFISKYIVYFRKDISEVIEVEVRATSIYDAFAQASNILQAQFPNNTFKWLRTRKHD